jgi:dipeptidyl aminopeptidase/acylaminoacyl peptidase
VSVLDLVESGLRPLKRPRSWACWLAAKRSCEFRAHPNSGGIWPQGAIKRMKIVCEVLAIFLGSVVPVQCVARTAQQSTDPRSVQLRRFTVNDLFRLQELGSAFGGPYAYSVPTGALAVTILRPIETDPSQRWSALAATDWVQSNGRGDIWVQPTTDKLLTNITRGGSDKSGWFAPEWSPDGVHLAMLSTRGGQLRMWTWNRLTGRLRPASGDELTLGSAMPGVVVLDRPYVWLDSREILCTVLPRSERQEVPRTYGYMGGTQTPPLAIAAWHQYLSGTQSTASVIDDVRASGPAPVGDLVLINLDGQAKVLARNVDTHLWQPSPARDAVAFPRPVKATPMPTKYVSPGFGGVWRLTVVTVDGRRIVTTGDRARDVIPRSLRWSPDGQILAYLGYAGEFQVAPSLYLLNMRTDRVRAIVLKGLNVEPSGGQDFTLPRLHWTNGGDLLVRGARMRASTRGNAAGSTREDWWLISRDAVQRCLTCRLATVPMSLWPERGRDRFFGLAGGRLWEVDVSSGNIIDLTKRLHGTVTALISPMEDLDRSVVPGTYVEVAFQSKAHRDTELNLLDLRSDTITELSLPTERARVALVSPGGRSILYLEDDRSGLSLWRGNVHSRASKLLFSANAFLSGIAEGQLRHFPYTSLDGEKLDAWILLPPGYRPDRRYPMITWVYPTDNYSVGSVPWAIKYSTGITSEAFPNLQIAAARGYAVLFPSIADPHRERDEVRLKVVNDVLPAVAAAVRRGFADPHRLAVWGYSYGGEAVMDLISRTNLFRAAIASAGISDQISEWGALDVEDRYSKWAELEASDQFMVESGELNLYGPPWSDWFRYIENSPIFSVNRVHTPLLLTVGDLDGRTPMQQSEEFFRALVRQGKPVRFVRYWGEGHVLSNPANIRNYWQQVFRWLQRYIPGYIPPDRPK